MSGPSRLACTSGALPFSLDLATRPALFGNMARHPLAGWRVGVACRRAAPADKHDAAFLSRLGAAAGDRLDLQLTWGATEVRRRAHRQRALRRGACRAAGACREQQRAGDERRGPQVEAAIDHGCVIRSGRGEGRGGWSSSLTTIFAAYRWAAARAHPQGMTPDGHAFTAPTAARSTSPSPCKLVHGAQATQREAWIPRHPELILPWP